MPDVATYAPGTPMWIDLSTPDVKAASAFYGKLFGWEAHVTPEPEAGGYTMFTLKGKEVGAAGPLQNPQQPPAWMMYVATDDAERTAKKVQEAGGTVIAPPFDVMKAGRMAVFQDPTGAFFSVWQPKEHQGAEIVNESNAWSWSELYSRDMAKAKAFYQKVFGWGLKETPGEPPYTEFQVDGRSVAGGMPMSMMPAEVPPHWATYFNVANLNESLKTVKGQGGRVLFGPQDTPMGPFATVQDPQGATFNVIEIRS
ncbi:MAG TPA: VOC family protein [Candidatus Limnocylindrales bacterium]|nr:VOC family protein [Candidatus Limnocylindrales bacterium]